MMVIVVKPGFGILCLKRNLKNLSLTIWTVVSFKNMHMGSGSTLYIECKHLEVTGFTGMKLAGILTSKIKLIYVFISTLL